MNSLNNERQKAYKSSFQLRESLSELPKEQRQLISRSAGVVNHLQAFRTGMIDIYELHDKLAEITNHNHTKT